MLGLESYELLLIMSLVLLSVLLKLWRILSKTSASNDGQDIGIMVDQLLASNIDSLLNRYTLISESRGAYLSRDLGALRKEVLWRLDQLGELLNSAKSSTKDINAQKQGNAAPEKLHGENMEDDDD